MWQTTRKKKLEKCNKCGEYIGEPCWKGYKQIGMKDKDGKQVPNCVPESTEDVAFSGDYSRADVGKKKKKKFEFKEELNEDWKELEHYLIEDSTNSGQKSDTVGNPEFRSFTHSSSFVGNVIWDRESRQMNIILNGKTYSFCRVSERLFDSFEGASSKGAFFNREIKTLHDC